MHNNLTKEEIINLLESSDEELFVIANKIRKENKKEYIHLRALIEFTNICKCNCLYCGLRCENKKINRYRLTQDEILNCVKNAVNLGYKTIVLQGGEDIFWTTDKVCNLIKEIKKYDVALTLSIGERTYEDYKAFKSAGADRYLLRIETTNKELYKKMHPNMSYENRIRCLKDIKNLGYEVGTGSLVGLPNQSIESLADDLLFFKELDADMVGIGPFIPHQNTPLANEKNNNFDLSLRVMAIARILLPKANIPATTAMETLKPNGRIIALNSGANVIMPNFTNANYINDYEIYPNKASLTSIEEIEKLGRIISKTKGFKNDL